MSKPMTADEAREEASAFFIGDHSKSEATLIDVAATLRAYADMLDKQKDVSGLAEALENAMGHLDTPIGRRKLGIDTSAEWLVAARATLSAYKGGK